MATLRVSALAVVVLLSACGSSSGGGSTSLITQGSSVGNWTLAFQWHGRTPGLVKLENHADGVCMSPGGQPGDNAQDAWGTWKVTGNTIEWTWSDSTWTATATSATAVAGTMKDQKGGSGIFNGCENVDTCALSSGSSGGTGTCHTNSDCGSRQICRSGTCQTVGCTNDAQCGNCQRCISNSCSSCGYGPYGCYC